MTTPKMIAIVVILVAVLISSIICLSFELEDHFKRKNCHYFCFNCEYKNQCDWYVSHKK